MKNFNDQLTYLFYVIVLIALIAFYIIVAQDMTDLIHASKYPPCPETSAEAHDLYGGLDKWETKQDENGVWSSTLLDTYDLGFSLRIPMGHTLIMGTPENPVTMDTIHGALNLEITKGDGQVSNQLYTVTCQ